MKQPSFPLLLLTLLVAFTLALQVFVLQQPAAVIEEPIHFHAGFAVVLDGQHVDFSGPQFMHLGTCDETGSAHAEIDPTEEQLEKAHLHDRVGNVVHVHRDGVTWRDLFQNINYTLPQGVIGYRDGVTIPVPLTEPITTYDRVLFLDDQAQAAELFESLVPTIERIKEVEAEGESC